MLCVLDQILYGLRFLIVLILTSKALKTFGAAKNFEDEHLKEYAKSFLVIQVRIFKHPDH